MKLVMVKRIVEAEQGNSVGHAAESLSYAPTHALGGTVCADQC